MATSALAALDKAATSRNRSDGLKVNCGWKTSTATGWRNVATGRDLLFDAMRPPLNLAARRQCNVSYERGRRRRRNGRGLRPRCRNAVARDGNSAYNLAKQAPTRRRILNIAPRRK